jgi:hypothetical protein
MWNALRADVKKKHRAPCALSRAPVFYLNVEQRSRMEKGVKAKA